MIHLCICGKSEKIDRDTSPKEVKTFYIITLGVIIISAPFAWVISILATAAILAMTIPAFVINILNGHRFLCNLRYAIIAPLRITQYF